MKTRNMLAVVLCMSAAVAADSAIERDPPLAAPMPLSASESLRGHAARSDRLAALFERIGYDLEAVRRSESAVPRLLIPDLPKDLGELDSVDARKRIFIAVVLPAILHVNEEVRADREVVERVRVVHARGEVPDSATRSALERIAESYGVGPDEIDRLLERVDLVPVSLALAQAAIESGWGTSRFAQHGNALFGQRTYGDRDAGLKPSGVVDADFRVRSFPDPANSVAAYLRSLNTHPAYAAFRRKRAEMRESGAVLDAHALAATLTRYSERGAAYVADVRTVMQTNRLKSFDRARLGEETTLEFSL
jgi:Bax protein